MIKKELIFGGLVVIYLLSMLYTYADVDWKTEFDNLCGKTEETITMRIEELKDLVARCDKLKPIIESSNHPQKKIFLKRIEKCRNLFIYMLEVKAQERR